jgi:hypothetical protein
MSPDLSIYVELLVCPWQAPFPLTYWGGEGIVLQGCEDPEVDEGVEGKTEFECSVKNSEGEKASGLLCGGESQLWFERASDGAFLRTGRIHAGREALAGSSWPGVSTGILVTNKNRKRRLAIYTSRMNYKSTYGDKILPWDLQIEDRRYNGCWTFVKDKCMTEDHLSQVGLNAVGHRSCNTEG